MSKSLLLLSLFLAVCGIATANPFYVSAAGRFSGSDAVGPLISPNGQFALSFVVDSNPTPIVGSVTNLGFDVPVLAFSYTLNGSAISVNPSEIRFNTLANGGLFDITFGSDFGAPAFSFQGTQAFSGSTAVPVFSIGSYPISSWTYSDSRNFDAQTPTGLAASINSVPEPSSIFLMACGSVSLLAVSARKFGWVR